MNLHHFLLRIIFNIREKKMKGLLKTLTGILALAACIFAFETDARAATGIYIGKDVSAEGTTVLGSSTEATFGMTPVYEVMEKGALKKGDVISAQNGYNFKMPVDSAKLTLTRTMSNTDFGQWIASASNEYGVSVVANITTTTDIDAQIADPFVENGVSEEKIALIVAASCKSAREAVELLCSEYDEAGVESAEIVLIADKDGAWVVENFTGHQYVATKLPDDKMATFSNEPVIRNANPDDPDTICSKELFTLPEENDFAIYDSNKKIDLILTYNDDNSYTDECHLRGWIGHDIFAPSEELDYDADVDYDVFFTPDEKVSLAQAFAFYRNRNEGTAYDLSDSDNVQMYWGINNQMVGNVDIIQVFDDVPAEISSVIWTTPANPTASPFIPIPAFADELPEIISTDVEEESLVDGILQFELVKLNNNILPRRNLYGSSIRDYWEGLESVTVKDVTGRVRGSWKDAFEDSPEMTIGDLNIFVDRITDSVQDDCQRLNDELNWYFYKNGIRRQDIPDDELQPFECSSDAVSYAHKNGWETTIEGDVFTATKDGKTIEVVFDGENKGDITFTGFDNAKLAEDFLGDYAEDIEEEEDTDTLEEEAEEKEKEKALGQKLEEEKEEEVTDDKEEPADGKIKKDKAKADPEKVDEITKEAAEAIEVDTIAELEDYFAEKIADIPRDGWAENEIKKELGDVSKGVASIITKHFTGDIEELIGKDYTKVGADIVTDPALAMAEEKIVEVGEELTVLTGRYFDSLYEDVESDIVAGRLTQDGAVKILSEAEGEIEGIATIYLEGLEGIFDDVFDTTLSDEEFNEILGEIAEGAVTVMDDYDIIDMDALGLSDIDVKDLTDADIEVVVTLEGMDDDVLDGLSGLLGVDVRSTLDAYMEALADDNGKVTLIEEKHLSEEADNIADEEIKAVTELEETLSEDDIEIPQEVIDILREAIKEASGEDPYEEASVGDSAEAEGDTSSGESFTINIGNVTKSGQKVMLPANMLKYFN